MNRKLIETLIDAIANGNDEVVSESTKQLTLEKTREALGIEPINEVGAVQLKNNDVFVSGKRVGTVNIDSDDAVVEFTDLEGNSKQFDDTEELHKYLNGLNESRQERLQSAVSSLPDGRGKRMDDAAKSLPVDGNAGDGEKGDYNKHSLKDKLHKDDHMEAPKKHDHGHDDASGVDAKDAKPKGGKNPPDKEKDLKSEHKDDRMENPKKHDHGHDDKSGK